MKYLKAALGPRFSFFCSKITDSDDPITNIMRIMLLSRKEALRYMRAQEAILLTAIPSKRVIQHVNEYEHVPPEDQELYAMMSDLERKQYLENLSSVGRGNGVGWERTRWGGFQDQPLL